MLTGTGREDSAVEGGKCFFPSDCYRDPEASLHADQLGDIEHRVGPSLMKELMPDPQVSLLLSDSPLSIPPTSPDFREE